MKDIRRSVFSKRFKHNFIVLRDLAIYPKQKRQLPLRKLSLLFWSFEIKINLNYDYSFRISDNTYANDVKAGECKLKKLQKLHDHHLY